MSAFKAGDRVSIHTRNKGCYHGKQGTVQSIITNDTVLRGKDGFRYSLKLPAGWVEVRFDMPVDLGDGATAKQDVFEPSELTLL